MNMDVLEFDLLLTVIQVERDGDALQSENTLCGRPTNSVILIVHRLRETNHQIYLKDIHKLLN